MSNTFSNLPSIAETSLATVHGGARKRSAEATAQRKVNADRASAKARYNRPPDTAAGQAVRDGLSSIPGVNGEAGHRFLRGVTEGTAFNGAVPAAL
jgi:hypothetical protein